MTQDEIIEVAKYVGFNEHHAKFDTRFERFAKLIAAKEREACAKLCDERINYWQRDDNRRDEDEQCAAAIRARGEA